MKRTMHDHFRDALVAKGWTTDYTSATKKYTVMTKPGVAYKLFIGKSGALRYGKNSTTSRPLPDKGKKKLLAFNPDANLDALSSALEVG
jgi:hypothetical protein